MIAFSCPHCGVSLQVKESLAGIARPCPNCSRVVRAPGSAVVPARAATAARTGQQGSGQKSNGRSSSPTLGAATATEDTAHPVGERTTNRPYPFLAPPEGPDEMGRLGPYVVRKVLGVGAMGVVFEAEDPKLRRSVALKVMKPSLAAFAEYHRRFLREAQLAAAIDHDHIVTIYQVDEDGGVPYLAMKLLQGETLEDRLNNLVGGLPAEEVMRIGREVAEGLAAAHERGLIHRDIKPANVWLEAGRDRVKILDFGLACGTTEDGRFTQAGAVIGTPAYMSPEQANATEVDARCDLFSLGAVLYRACTGDMPFGGTDTLSVLSALATKTPPAPHAVDPSIPRPFSDLVMRLLAKDRNKRPQSARDVVTAVEAIEKALAAKAAAPPPAEDVPVAKILAPEARPAAPAPAPSVNGTRVKEPPARARETDSDVARKAKKPAPRPAPKRKSGKGGRDPARMVLFGSLALLGVAVMILMTGILYHFMTDREDPRIAPKQDIKVNHTQIGSSISNDSTIQKMNALKNTLDTRGRPAGPVRHPTKAVDPRAGSAGSGVSDVKRDRSKAD